VSREPIIGQSRVELQFFIGCLALAERANHQLDSVEML